MKGKITLYDSDGQEIKSADYKDVQERKRLYRFWKSECKEGMGYYFIISPIAEFKLSPTQQLNWGKLFYPKVHPVYHKKEPLVRPKAIYSNPKSPYGIADELHNFGKP